MSVAPCDLPAAFECARRKGESAFYRRDADGEELLAIGGAEGADFGDLRSMAAAFEILQTQLEGPGLEDLRFFGWTAFDPEFSTQRDTTWRAFPRRALFVPRLCLRQEGEEAQAVLAGAPGDLAEGEQLLRLVQEARVEGNDLGAHETIWLDGDAFRAGVQRVAEERLAPKVVLARRALVRAQADFNSAQILANLGRRYRSCTLYAISTTSSQAFIGATPEQLAGVRLGRVETMALAGTAAAGDGANRAVAEEALLSSSKDLQEHRYVVEMITEALAPLTTEVDTEQRPKLQRLANVTHLHTPISGRLRPGVGLADVVDALHPTPAVCGVPQLQARNWIRELENFDRGLYAGALGYMNLAGEGVFDVAIRCAMTSGREATLYTGAGITAASDVEVEWAETARKAEAMLQALEESL